MYKLVKFEATNVIGFLSGTGTKKFKLDLTDHLDKDIFVVVGDNATGKSTFLSLIHPIHTPSDGRAKFIVPGKEGTLKRTYKGDDGSILTSLCIYYPKPDGLHNVKCFLSLKRSGEKDAMEMNPSGNISSYNSLLLTYFGITKDYVNFASYSDAVNGIVSMGGAERKSSVNSLVPNTGRFEFAYFTINEKYKELRNMMRNIAQKIMAIRDEDTLDDELAKVTKELTKAYSDQEELAQKLGKAEGRIKELSHGQDIKQMAKEYNDMIMSIASMDSSLSKIRNRLFKLYDILNLEVDFDNGVAYVGAEKLGSTIAKYERKIGNSEATIQSASKRLEKLEDEINRTETEITKTESILYSLQAQDINDLKKSRMKYLDQLDELSYTHSKDQYEDMTYTECVNFSKAISTMQYMIQSLYDQFGEMVSTYFDELVKNEDHTHEHSLNQWSLNVSIETKTEKRDEIYRQLIEKEQYRKFQDTLEQRPRECKIDSCPFIATALKWSHISGEIAELQEAYNKINLELTNEKTQLADHEKYLELKQASQNFIKFVQDNADLLLKYLKLTMDDVYTAVAKCTWNEVLDIMKVKRMAAVLSEKDLYIKITEKLIPELDQAIEIAKVYGTNRELMSSQIERLKSTLELLNEERSDYQMSKTISSSMKNTYATKLAYWREVSELLKEYQDLAREQLKTTENAKSREKGIKTIAELVDKCNDLNEKLDHVHDVIYELTPMKQQIQIELAELLRLKAEKDQVDHDFVIVDIMRQIIQPGKGIRKELLNIYFYDIYQTANQLLLNTFNGKLRLHEFVITDKEFTIPFEYAGEIGSDVAYASSSQRATIAIAISMAIISKLVDKYSIVAFDESDQSLSPANKSVFVDIVTKQMKTVGIEQSFIITHSPDYYVPCSNVCFIGFPGWDKNDTIDDSNDIIVIDD